MYGRVFLRVCVRACVYLRACVCVCEGEWKKEINKSGGRNSSNLYAEHVTHPDLLLTVDIDVRLAEGALVLAERLAQFPLQLLDMWVVVHV